MRSKNITHAPIILASASPRRLELLDTIGIVPADVCPADIDETPQPQEKPAALALRLASQKADAIFAQNKSKQNKSKECYVLAADTVVSCGARLLEKPQDEAEATRFLKRLSGRRHRVYSGLCVIAPDGEVVSRVSETVVQFKRLDQAEINAYLASGEWQGKAGGYGIQGLAACFVKSIKGSYSNVVGLCLYDTMNVLKGIGAIKM